MALGVFNEIDPNAETFSAWLSKSNEMIRIFEGQGPGLHSAMTAIDGGWAETIGNSILTGTMVANVMVVHDELRGGNNLSTGTLFVSTNTTFEDTSDIVFVDSTIKLEVTNNTEIHQSLLVADVGGDTLAAAVKIYGNTFVEEYLEIGSQGSGLIHATHETVDSLKVTGANVVFNTYSSNSVSLIRTSVDGDLEISADVGANGVGVSMIDMNVDGINAISIDSANVDFYNDTGVATKMRWVGDTDTSEGSLLVRKLLPIANAALDVDGEARVDQLTVDGSVTSNVYVGNTNWTDGTAGHAHWVNIRKSDASVSGLGWQTTLADNTTFLDTVVKTTADESLVIAVDDTARGITTADIDIQTAGVRRMTTYANGDVSFTETAGVDRLIWDGGRGAEGYLRHLDNVRASWGDGDDLVIYHEGSNTYITETAGGDLNIQANNFVLENTAGGNYINMTASANVDIYYNGVSTPKVSTTDYGIVVDGQSNTGSLRVRTDAFFDGSTDGLTATLDSNNIEWTSLSNTMNFDDNTYLEFGTSGDFKIHHDGTDTFLQDTSGTGNVHIDTNDLIIRNAAGTQTQATFEEGSSVTLYHNDVSKLQTNATGIEVYGEANTVTLRVQENAYFDGSSGLDADSLVWESANNTLSFEDNVYASFGTSEDLKIYHTAADSYIDDQGTGNLVIRSTNLQLTASDDSRYIAAIDGTQVEYYSPSANTLEMTINDDGLQIENAANTDTLRVRSTSVFEDDITIQGDLGNVEWNRSEDALRFDDNQKLTFGNTVDISIQSNGSAALIDTLENSLLIRQFGNDLDVVIQTDDSTGGVTDYIRADGSTGSVLLSHYGSTKLQTTTSGATTTGVHIADGYQAGDNEKLELGDSQDLMIYHDGTNSVIDNSTGNLEIKSQTADADVVIQTDNGSGGLVSYFIADGSTGESRLFHYGAEKFATKSTGATLTGTLVADGVTVGDNEIIQLGTTMQLYNDGSASVITETGSGSLVLQGNNIVLEDTAGTNYIRGVAGDAVEVTHAGNVKLETTSTGINVTGNVVSDGLNVDGNAYVSTNTHIGGTSDATHKLQVTGDAKVSTVLTVTGNILTNGKVLPITEFNDLGSNIARWDAFLGNVNIGDTKNVLPEVTATSAATGSDIGSDALRFNIYGHIGDFTGDVQVDGNITTGGDVTLTTGDLTVSTGGITVQDDSTFNSNVVFTNIQVDGIANIQLLEIESIAANNVALIGNGQIDIAVSTPGQVLDTFPLSQSRGLKYMVQGDNGNPASAFVIEIMVAHNDSGVFFTRYAEVSNAFDCTLTPVINGTNMDLQVECPSGSGSNVHSFNIVRTEVR